MAIYALRPQTTRFNMWVCYVESDCVTLRDDMVPLACQKCNRVSPSAVRDLPSVKVTGFKDRFSMLAVTCDNYTVCNSDFIEVISQNSISGLTFLPIEGADGCHVVFAENLLHVDSSGMVFRNGACEKCGRPFSSNGLVRFEEQPEGMAIYGLDAEYFSGHSGYRHLVCNGDVEAVLSADGCDAVLQDASTLAFVSK